MPPPAVNRAEFSNVESSLRQHLMDCTKENKETRETLDTLSHSLLEIEGLIRTIKQIVWRAFVGLVGTVLTVGITVLFQNWNAQQNAAAHADHLVRSSANAEQDRQTLMQQNTDILAEIRKDKRGNR